MRSEWPRCLLATLAANQAGAIAIGPFGSRLKTDAYTDSGVALIRGSNLASSKLLSGAFVYVSEETARGLGNANVKPLDLVFPHRGNIGAVGLVPEGVQRYALSTSLMKVTLDRQRVDPLFMYYFFRSSLGQTELLKNSSQVGTPGIATPLTSLRACVVPVPPLEEQTAAARVLSLLDDRVDLLRQTNATLESIAQALFKSWFIDFDPVRAKAEGREPEGMDAATAALFPATFEESALGLIPTGWHVRKLSELCESIFSGGTPDTRKPEYWNGTLPWFSSGETRESVVIGTEKHITEAAVENSSTRLARPGDILIASAGQGLTRGQTSYCALNTYINQSVVSVRINQKTSSPAWTFYNLARRYEELRGLSDSHSIRGSLTTKLLASLRVVAPPASLMHCFGATAEALLSAQAENRRQALVLTELRDTLLPRLISGQLRLPTLQVQVEEFMA